MGEELRCGRNLIRKLACSLMALLKFSVRFYSTTAGIFAGK
jgi:hypothetical protein